MKKQKKRCGLHYCTKKAVWKFTIMGSRNVAYGYCEDYMLFRCIDHKDTIDIDEKFILGIEKHPNIFGDKNDEKS